MKKIIFLSLPAQGHTNPTLNIAQALKKEGNEVIYYSYEEFKQQIEATGVTFRAYNFQTNIDRSISRNLGKMTKELLAITKKELPALLKEIKQLNPDCIAHDSVILSGKIIAHQLQIPAVSLITTPAFSNKIVIKYPRQFINIVTKGFLTGSKGAQALYDYKKILSFYDMKGNVNDLVMNKEKLNIVFTSSYFHPCIEAFDDTYRFVGPSIRQRIERDEFMKKLKKDKKIIYISLGTVINDNLTLYRLLVNTFSNSSYQVILSLGKRFDISDLGPIPENVIVKRYLNQLEVLQRADVFISHAGMNGVNESLYYGVPLVLIPDTDEQTIIALRTQELGAGILLDKNRLTKKLLIQTTEKVLGTKSFYTQAGKIKKSLHEAGGYKKAAEEILHYIKNYPELQQVTSPSAKSYILNKVVLKRLNTSYRSIQRRLRS